MKKLNILVLLASAILFSASGYAKHFKYPKGSYLAFTYQFIYDGNDDWYVKDKNWYGCGPVLCHPHKESGEYNRGYREEYEVFEILSFADIDDWTFIGEHGRCSVYARPRGTFEADSISPNKILRLMRKAC